VVGAAQPALFVAPKKERGKTVGARLRHQAHLPRGVTKGEEVLTQEPHAQGRSFGMGKFGGQQGRHPILPQEVAHQGPGPDACQEIVLFLAQHAASGVLSLQSATRDIPN
jgi:hypothetical protein